jgi:TRAP-type C4-dicarboxylate transport system permease large subunit
VGRLKGGLAIATTLTCTVFAALCGSSPATAASIGKISIAEMTKRGYNPSFAVGTVAAGGTLGIMIPPSITFCLYAMLTENSIVDLFMAGIIPGLVLSLMLIISIMIRVRMNPELIHYSAEGAGQSKSAADMDMAEAREIVAAAAATGKADTPVDDEDAKKTRGPTFVTILPAFALIFIVLGSMYFGFATPLEAAAYGVVGSLVILIFQRRLTKKIFSSALLNTAKTGSMMVFLIICGFSMTFVVSYLGIPQAITTAIAISGLSKYTVLLLMYVLWFILGCLMDPTSMVLLTIPFLYRPLMELGFDPLWVGVVCVLGAQIAMITPPVGMNLFVLKANSDIPMTEIIKGCIPYVAILFAGLALFTVFPGIATFLPYLIK